MRFVTTVLCCALPLAATAATPQTDTVGGQGNDVTGSGSFKLVVFEVNELVLLDHFSFYMEPRGGGSEVHFVVYREPAGPGGWDLIWDSGRVGVGPGLDYKASPVVGGLLFPGNVYGIGVFLPEGEDVTYFYGDVGLQDLGWARVNQGYWTANGTFGAGAPPDPAFGTLSDSPYHLRITVLHGDDVDGDGFVEFIDCDDTDPQISPAAPEACDGIDNNCNDEIDENVTYRDVYPDADGDGFGDGEGTPISTCEPEAPAGYADRAGDCDDSRAAVNPEAPEICDGLDNDCDGTLLPDEDIDGDLDGVPVCADCDDADPDVFPGRSDDPCNGRDNDCDGSIPEGAECEPEEALAIATACGCQAGGRGPTAGWLLGGLLALGLRRRRAGGIRSR